MPRTRSRSFLKDDSGEIAMCPECLEDTLIDGSPETEGDWQCASCGYTEFEFRREMLRDHYASKYRYE